MKMYPKRCWPVHILSCKDSDLKCVYVEKFAAFLGEISGSPQPDPTEEGCPALI